MTRTALGVAALLLAGTVSACGSSGAPTDASVEEFCEAHRYDAFVDITFRGDVPSKDEVADRINDWGEEAAAVGTPAGIPDEARAGFETVIEDARELEARNIDDDRSDEPEPEVKAFDAYVEETCRGEEDDLGLPEVPALPSP